MGLLHFSDSESSDSIVSIFNRNMYVRMAMESNNKIWLYDYSTQFELIKSQSYNQSLNISQWVSTDSLNWTSYSILFLNIYISQIDVNISEYSKSMSHLLYPTKRLGKESYNYSTYSE